MSEKTHPENIRAAKEAGLVYVTDEQPGIPVREGASRRARGGRVKTIKGASLGKSWSHGE